MSKSSVNAYYVVMVLFIIFLIGIIICLAIYLNQIQTITNSQSGQPSQTTIGNDSCQVAIQDLPDISNIPCCVVNNTITPQRYIDTINVPNIGNITYNLTTSTTATNYLTVCQGFCENYNVQAQECINGDPGQQSFQNCVNLTKPRNCNGPAMPIAVVGINPYYASVAGNLCPNPNNQIGCLQSNK